MSDTPRAGAAYPFVVAATGTGFAASALQFPSLATAATRAELDRLMREQVALHLLGHRLDGTSPSPPKGEGELDLADWAGTEARPEVVYAAPAAVNEVSVAIEVALREQGVTYAELARRMGVPRSVVTRLTDPFYFGHTTRTLRNVARALGRALRVAFVEDRDRPVGAVAMD